MVHTVTRSCRLRAPPGEVWRCATSMPEVDREMRPILRMTWPREADARALDDPGVPVGEPLFTSWILLFGVLPVDRMRVTLAEVEPGRRFVERSTPAVLRSWRHAREVAPDGEGCRVTDTLELEAPAFGGAVAAFVGWFFSHRHRRLRARFGAA